MDFDKRNLIGLKDVALNALLCYTLGIATEGDMAKYPDWFERLVEDVHGQLSQQDARRFDADLRKSITVGFDFDGIKAPFLVALQKRNLGRVVGDGSYAVQCREAIQCAIDWLDAGMIPASMTTVKLSPLMIMIKALDCGLWTIASQARVAWECGPDDAARCAVESAGRSSPAVQMQEVHAQRDDILRLVRGSSC